MLHCEPIRTSISPRHKSCVRAPAKTGMIVADKRAELKRRIKKMMKRIRHWLERADQKEMMNDDDIFCAVFLCGDLNERLQTTAMCNRQRAMPMSKLLG